ncbi:MAG: hypothetical protein AAF206_14385, partial [Bacteroidota bacterium]
QERTWRRFLMMMNGCLRWVVVGKIDTKYCGGVRKKSALFAGYGIYYGMSSGVIKAYLTELAPPDQKASVFGLFQMATGLALLPASVFMGWLWEHISSQVAFTTGAGLATIGWLVMAVSFRTQAK